MAEGPQGQVRSVDVLPVPVRAPARRLVRVVDRDLADVAGHGDRKLATGVAVAEQDRRDRGGALVAGHPGVQDRGRSARPPRGSRAVARTRARGRAASRWRPRRRRAPPGAPGARAPCDRASRRRCSPTSTPERSPTTTIDDVRAAGGGDGLRELGVAGSRARRPRREAHLGAVGTALADGVEDRRASLELVGQIQVVGEPGSRSGCRASRAASRCARCERSRPAGCARCPRWARSPRSSAGRRAAGAPKKLPKFLPFDL